jgi:hypothetical protein
MIFYFNIKKKLKILNEIIYTIPQSNEKSIEKLPIFYYNV